MENSSNPTGAPSSAPDSTTNETKPSNTPQSNAQGSENATKPNSIAEAGEQALKKLYKVKVDGQDREVDEDELLKGYQLKEASYKRMQEAAREKKAYENRTERLRRETDKVLAELGVDPTKFAEEHLSRLIQQERMSPQERAIAEKEARIRELEARDREMQQAREQQELTQMAKQVEADLTNQFMKSFEKAGLELDAYGIKRVAEKYYLALEDGIENPDIDLLTELVQEDLERDLQKTIKRLSLDKRLKFLGDDVLKEIREADLARLKNPPSANNRPNNTSSSKSSSNKSSSAAKDAKRGMTTYEFREWLEKQKQ